MRPNIIVDVADRRIVSGEGNALPPVRFIESAGGRERIVGRIIPLHHDKWFSPAHRRSQKLDAMIRLHVRFVLAIDETVDPMASQRVESFPYVERHRILFAEMPFAEVGCCVSALFELVEHGS